jgi:argininosuccinate synthase
MTGRWSVSWQMLDKRVYFEVSPLFSITLTAFIEDFEAAKAKALKIGALSCHVVDLKKEMVSITYRAIQCNAIYESTYLLGPSGSQTSVILC